MPDASTAGVVPAHRGGMEMMSRRCDQCLMGPNKVVSNIRKSQLLRDMKRTDSHFICHKSPEGREIICRGHVDATGGGQMVRIAGRLGVIHKIDPETFK